MRQKIKKIIEESIAVKTVLFNDDKLIAKIEESVELILKTLKENGKILIFGNGGSAADSQHFAAELVGRFQKERKALPAIALTCNTSVLTCLGNDYSFDTIFKRQIEALANTSDIVFAISTSGNAKNVIAAVEKAKKLKIKTIGLTGKNGGQLGKICDTTILAPSIITARIQEAHILIIHIICELIEEAIEK